MSIPADRSPGELITDLIDSFVAAWPRKDASSLGRFFSADAVYVNGPLEPVTGRDSIVTSIEEFMEMGGTIRVDMVNQVVAGPIVMTERVDHVTQEGKTLSLRVAGTFEVRGGEITAWRDYFDLGEFMVQLTGGGDD